MLMGVDGYLGGSLASMMIIVNISGCDVWVLSLATILSINVSYCSRFNARVVETIPLVGSIRNNPESSPVAIENRIEVLSLS